MQIQIFNIPLTDTGEALSEMNRFMTGRKVLEVEQRFFQNEKGGGWSFCVRYLPDVTQSGATGSRAKVDYKQVLTESQFAVFSRLREIRKALANEDGVPAYAVFTDEELAGICRLAELTEKSLATLPGIGEKKIIRYGKSMLKRYHTDNNTHTAQADEIQIGGQG